MLKPGGHKLAVRQPGANFQKQETTKKPVRLEPISRATSATDKKHPLSPFSQPLEPGPWALPLSPPTNPPTRSGSVFWVFIPPVAKQSTYAFSSNRRNM